VWTEAPHATAPAVATVDHPHDHDLYQPAHDYGDRYQVDFDGPLTDQVRVMLFVNSAEYYALDCQWRASTCMDYLPVAARGARIMLISANPCPTFRLMREDVRLEITQPFHWGCAFVLGEQP
jgi:hypothetical protein